MATKKEETASNEDLISKLTNSISRLRDDVHLVKAEMASFKQAVQFDIQRLVEIREKDVEQIKAQFQKKK